MKCGCPGACGQKNNVDELVCGADEVVVVADAVGIVTIDEDLCHMLNSLVETRGALQFVSVCVSRFVMFEMSLHVSCFVMRMVGWEVVG